MSGVLAVLAAALWVLPPSSLASRRVRFLAPEAVAGVRVPARASLIGRVPRVRMRQRLGPAEQLRIAAGWDLLAAALRAGLPVPEAIRVITGGLPTEPADALRATAELLALGADADSAWDPVAACRYTASLARAGRRAGRSGTALASAVADLAAAVRAGTADVAESRAQRAGVAITAPLGLCFLPGFLCLGVVPVVFGLAERLTVLGG